MPTDNELDNEPVVAEPAEPVEPVTEPKEPVAQPAPAPSFDYAALGDRIAAGVADGISRVTTAAQKQQQANTVPDDERIYEVKDDDPENIKMAKVAHNAAAPLRKQLREASSFVVDRVGEIAIKTHLGDREYYPDYKGEVDAEVAKLEPTLRTSKEALDYCYNTVVARHVNDISEKKAAAKLDAEKRRAAATAAPKPGERTGRGSAQPKNPNEPVTLEDVLSEDQISLMEDSGGPLAFVRRMGYATVEDYVKRVQNLRGAKRTQGGYVISFPRAERKPRGQRQGE